MTIGGVNNTFKHCVIDTTRGSGLYVWNTNDDVYITNVSFTNANTAHSKTPWGGNTDDGRGASLAIGVQNTDTNAVSCLLIVKNYIHLIKKKEKKLKKLKSRIQKKVFILFYLFLI